ncbi:MAG: O-antigen ligase family protein [Chloroflexi bacterium]|nr:O-antigen ligase family protein [Chloroflexota bacterium]
MIWLLGTLVLLPVDLIKLPLNMLLVDCWILIALPIFWLSFVRGRYVINLSYTVAMWVILLASFASTFAAPAPSNSFVVILKEVYVYVWFVTLIAVLSRLNARDFRRILVVWSGIVFLHGFVIVAQFLSPAIWRLTVSFADSLKEFEMYRPSGLFVNANSAAFFQLLGFVPLVLASPSKKVTMILGLLLLPTMLLTGSMGATVALTTGLMIAVITLSLSGHLVLIIKIFAQLAIIMSLLGGLLFFIISQNQNYQDHFERILFGRSEKSSEGRFDLWQRGFDAYVDNNVLLWGVGPENFREVDAKMTDNQLHNDFLAFSVERGLLGTLGLVLFAIIAVSRAAYMVLICNKYPDRSRLVVVVFLAAMVAAMVESLTHQTFHFRELWLVLAFQEAMLFKVTRSESGVEPTPRALDGPPQHRRGFVVQPDVTGG